MDLRKKRLLRKYGIRLFIAILVYIFFHVSSTSEEFGLELFRFTFLDRLFVLYTLAVVIGIWEVLDLALNNLKFQYKDLTQYRNVFRLLLVLTLVTAPLVISASWVSEYVIKASFRCCDKSIESFIKMCLQGQLLAWLIIAERLIHLNYEQAKKRERDQATMQKKLLESQYVNLKNQVNPHFLFNNFSVLQSLIETEPEVANRFVSQLSKIYRYMLENREESMSTLEKELKILDSYVYLLEIRHGESIQVSIKVDPQYHQFYVPTLSLQMLIENAVKHNLFSRKEPLIVDVFVEDHFIVVKNRLKKKGAVENSTKLGLENIRSQYKLQTEKSVIITEDEEYFTVKLPVLTGMRLT